MVQEQFINCVRCCPVPDEDIVGTRDWDVAEVGKSDESCDGDMLG